MKICVLQKILFYFSVFTSWKWFWGPIRKGKVCSPNFFLTFRGKLRCEILNDFPCYKACMNQGEKQEVRALRAMHLASSYIGIQVMQNITVDK